MMLMIIKEGKKEERREEGEGKGEEKEIEKEQGRIHGHQLRTGGQERKCAFSHFLTRAHRRTD